MTIEWRISRDIGGNVATRSTDDHIAELAGRQHGVVARWQLVDLGLGDDAINHRLAVHRLHPIHRGVYAVGHRLTTRPGTWLAAVLAAGPGAVLSHRSAAALWGIRDTGRARVDVTCRRRIERPGIDAHRAMLQP